MLADPARFSAILERFLPQITGIDPQMSGLKDATTGDREVSIADYAASHPLQNTCLRYPDTWHGTMEALGYTNTEEKWPAAGYSRK